MDRQRSSGVTPPWVQDILRRAERATTGQERSGSQAAGPPPPSPASPVTADELAVARRHFRELTLELERLLARLDAAAVPVGLPPATDSDRAAAASPAPLPASVAAHTDPALLRATEMAAAGHARALIAARLRDEFGVADPNLIFTAVFGPPAPGDPGRPRG